MKIGKHKFINCHREAIICQKNMSSELAYSWASRKHYVWTEEHLLPFMAPPKTTVLRKGSYFKIKPPLQSSLCHPPEHCATHLLPPVPPVAFQQLPPPPIDEFVKGCPQVLWLLTQRQTFHSATNFVIQQQTFLLSDITFTQRHAFSPSDKLFYSATNFLLSDDFWHTYKSTGSTYKWLCYLDAL